MNRYLAILLLAALSQLGSTCDPAPAPIVHLTLNGIPDTMNDLLVVPPSGFEVNVGFTENGDPVDPSTLHVGGTLWGGAELPALDGLFTSDATEAVGTIPAELALVPGSYTFYATVSDTAGHTGAASFSFAVRDFPGGTPPIGSGQQIWLDFEADRDADPGPDFPIDLQSFGLGSPAAPAVSDLARARVVAAVLARVRQAYDGDGLDPVSVVFTEQPPASGDVTRICVGGEDPSGGSTIGSIQIDPNNAARNSVECGTLPPTGVFPREMLVFQSQGWFQGIFDPLQPTRGGVPVGEDPWDAVVLDPSFDPTGAPPEAQARYTTVMTAITVFGDALGSIVAHEAGHALGLVPPGAPGVGLFGGSDGAAYTHSVNPDGSTPSENFLMKAGSTFSFAKLAGLGSYGLPVFRAIELAYLHDRVVLAPQVTQLLPPPTVTGVSPSQISGSSQLVTLTGDALVATPAVRLINTGYTYSAVGEAWLSSKQATFWVIPAQLPPGLYDLEVTNPDGQATVLPSSITIQ